MKCRLYAIRNFGADNWSVMLKNDHWSDHMREHYAYELTIYSLVLSLLTHTRTHAHIFNYCLLCINKSILKNFAIFNKLCLSQKWQRCKGETSMMPPWGTLEWHRLPIAWILAVPETLKKSHTMTCLFESDCWFKIYKMFLSVMSDSD